MSVTVTFRCTAPGCEAIVEVDECRVFMGGNGREIHAIAPGGWAFSGIRDPRPGMRCPAHRPEGR